MKELIPIFWQMTGMVIDFTLEPFWVPDLHPRSQERPSKSGRVPDFFLNYFINFFMFLGVLGAWTLFSFFFSFLVFFSFFLFRTVFEIGDWKIFGSFLV